MSAFATSNATVDDVVEAPKTLEEGKPNVAATGQAPFPFRIDLHDVSITVLEDDLDPDSQAIRLTVAQVSLSQQASVSPSIPAELFCSLLGIGSSCAHYDSSRNGVITHEKTRRRSNLG